MLNDRFVLFYGFDTIEAAQEAVEKFKADGLTVDILPSLEKIIVADKRTIYLH